MGKLRILALTYKTFPATLPTVHQAAVDALMCLGMTVLPQGSTEEGHTRIFASGERRELEVELEPQGTEETRARILARDGLLFEENTATELAAQVSRRLERRPRPTAPVQAPREHASVAIFAGCGAVATLAS